MNLKTAIFRRETWNNVTLKSVKNIPHNINGKCAFQLNCKSRAEAMLKCQDGRQWSDTSTTWKGYHAVRLRKCKGARVCPNPSCHHLSMSDHSPNNTYFNKNDECLTCGATATWSKCNPRKYIAIKDKQGENVQVFHIGTHKCGAKLKTDVSEEVRESLAVNISSTPTQIQGNSILTAMRNREPWEDVQSKATKLADVKSISNEKQKQVRTTRPSGTDFQSLHGFKTYTDQRDKFLIHEIDEANQIVFKSSSLKMKIAKEMDKNGDHFLSKEFCHFDGNHKRTRNYVTLSASVYHPLLRKQITLATMQCVREDGVSVEQFWRKFNDCFKAVHETDEKFSPKGWVTDMAAANFNGLVKIYGEDILEDIKGCEFHYLQSVQKQARSLNTTDEERDIFIKFANTLLTSQTPEGYNATYTEMEKLIGQRYSHLVDWLKWWNDRKYFVFRAFKRSDMPRMNQMEVVHAGWKHRDPIGLNLLDTAEFDVRDAIMLESQFDMFAVGGFSGGSGPNQCAIDERASERLNQAAHKKGNEFVQYGVRGSGEGSSIDCGSQPPTKRSKSSSSSKVFSTRMRNAKEDGDKMVIRKWNEVGLMREYTMASSTNSSTNYSVKLAPTVSCTCHDFKKMGQKAPCKHLIHLLFSLYQVSDETQLNKLYYTEDEIRSLFQTKVINDIPPQFIQSTTKKASTTSNKKQILQSHPLYTAIQTWKMICKKGKSAKCSNWGCKKELLIGTICLQVEGAIEIAWEKNYAKPRDFFYFCPNVSCAKSAPRWTNIKYPKRILVDSDVDSTVAANILTGFGYTNL